jgi:hypothetical protein
LLLSFDSFLALITLAALQLFPIPGIFLMFLGAAMITGLLVHVFLASLFIEAMMHRVPRVLVLVPILAYGGYYVAYINEAYRIASARNACPGAVDIRFAMSIISSRRLCQMADPRSDGARLHLLREERRPARQWA